MSTASPVLTTPDTEGLAAPAEWLLRLCAVDSTSGGEDRVLPLLRTWLVELGAEVRLHQVDRRRSNVFATWSTEDPATAPRVLLTTHLDTVPPFLPPRQLDGVVFGRGTCDAKGQIVAQLEAIRRLVASGERRVAWLGVVGEETDGAGADAAVRWSEMPGSLRAVVNGEPTENRLARAQKGCLHLALHCQGVPGHGALGDPDDNALWQLQGWLNRIRRLTLRHDPEFGVEQINLGQIVGGEAPNVVAASARADLVARTVPDSTLADDIAALAPPGASVTRLDDDPPWRFDVPEGWPSAPVAFGSDAPRLAALVPEGRVLQIGPGLIAVAHGEQEALDLAELDMGIETLERLCRQLLAESTEAGS